MKYIIALLLISLFVFSQPVTAQETNWYKCIKGAIDKYPVTMHLHKMGGAYAGYYYYESRQEPIYISGDDTTETGKIRLFGFSRSANGENEIFSFSNSDTLFSGTWKKDTLGKPLNFSAKLSADNALTPFKLIYQFETKELKPGMKESPRASFEAATIWPLNKNSNASFIEKTIREIFGKEKDETAPPDLFQNLQERFFSEYLEGYKDITEEELKDHPYTFSSEEINRVTLVYQTQKLLCLSNFRYAYTGGAHGNYSFTFFTLDLVNKKKLRLNDIVTESGAKQIPLQLEKYFRKAYNVPAKSKLTDEGLFENKIENNDNFCATGKGLFFSYAPYEIGPYAMGEITLFIPFSELQNYLRPEFKALLQ